MKAQFRLLVRKNCKRNQSFCLALLGEILIPCRWNAQKMSSIPNITLSSIYVHNSCDSVRNFTFGSLQTCKSRWKQKPETYLGVYHHTLFWKEMWCHSCLCFACDLKLSCTYIADRICMQGLLEQGTASNENKDRTETRSHALDSNQMFASRTTLFETFQHLGNQDCKQIWLSMESHSPRVHHLTLHVLFVWKANEAPQRSFSSKKCAARFPVRFRQLFYSYTMQGAFSDSAVSLTYPFSIALNWTLSNPS